MTDERREAAALMERALALLDEANEGLAAARLQHAIDSVSPDGWPDAVAPVAGDERRAGGTPFERSQKSRPR